MSNKQINENEFRARLASGNKSAAIAIIQGTPVETREITDINENLSRKEVSLPTLQSTPDKLSSNNTENVAKKGVLEQAMKKRIKPTKKSRTFYLEMTTIEKLDLIAAQNPEFDKSAIVNEALERFLSKFI